MARRDLLTIQEAGLALNLSGERIHQLLNEGELEGMPLPTGRKRHAPGAPRVTLDSVERLRSKRAAKTTAPSTARKRHRAASSTAPPASGRTSPPTTTSDRGSDPESERARSAAQELKVGMDALRDQLRAERGRSAKILEAMETLVGVLRESAETHDMLDDVAEAYSQALTQFLGPDDPSSGG